MNKWYGNLDFFKKIYYSFCPTSYYEHMIHEIKQCRLKCKWYKGAICIDHVKTIQAFNMKLVILWNTIDLS
jgi:hypothetical protein